MLLEKNVASEVFDDSDGAAENKTVIDVDEDVVNQAGSISRNVAVICGDVRESRSMKLQTLDAENLHLICQVPENDEEDEQFQK